MAIYVDDLKTYPIEMVKPEARRYGTRWCHLSSDEEIAKLHDFAFTLGLSISSFQNKEDFPHYDLTPGMRMKAIRRGAKPVSGVELVKLCKKPNGEAS
jgi:hypothetical protein